MREDQTATLTRDAQSLLEAHWDNNRGWTVPNPNVCPHLWDLGRFGSEHGPTNVAHTHASYDRGTYWRGTAWPLLNYLFWFAQLRWNRNEAADRLATQTGRSAVKSGWAEYWNPETGDGLGAIPQSWTGLVAAKQTNAMTVNGTDL